MDILRHIRSLIGGRILKIFEFVFQKSWNGPAFLILDLLIREQATHSEWIPGGNAGWWGSLALGQDCGITESLYPPYAWAEDMLW